MKRTPEDQQFGEEFANRLRPYYEAALAEGQSEQSFARRLGVDRGGLQRYLNKNATPSIRTLVHAFREFGITVPYAGIPTLGLVSRRTRSKYASEEQMTLPLTIEARNAELNLVVKKKNPQRYRIQVQVRSRAR